MIRDACRLRWRLPVCAVLPAEIEMSDEQRNRELEVLQLL